LPQVRIIGTGILSDEAPTGISSNRERPIQRGRISIAVQPILCQSTSMPSITLSQLRNTRLIWALLKAGETIELCERKRVIAHIIPARPWPFPDEDYDPKKKDKE
jgi:hypothetical protein